MTAPGRPFLIEEEQHNPTTNERRVVKVRGVTQALGGRLEVHPDGSGGISLTLTDVPDPDESKGATLDITIPDPKAISYLTSVGNAASTEEDPAEP